VQERTLDATGLKTTVRDGDLLTLFKISGQFANAVTLRGNVERPLRHAFKPGMRVADLVPEAAALILPDYYSRKNSSVQYEAARNDKLSGEKVANDVKTQLTEINWDYAAIERLDPKAVKTTLIPFNLGKAIKDKDPVHNIELKPGDVVTIFGVDDIPVPLEKRSQFVRLGGEVKAPGIYQVSPGETLPQLVQRAGGLSRDAYLYGTVLNREATRVQQQDNLNQAIRRMEAQVQSQAATTVQNVYDKDNLANAQAQAAGQRQMLERLRNLKASGRIALEMDADRPELPALTLQDGDSITVPSKPSFVAVFGAVLAENSFIHRANATVGDYIDKAGPTREADLEAVMLIRGDGTVLSNRAQRSWAGFGHAGFMGTRLQPGDSIFIPEVVDRRTPYTQFIQGAKDWTTILYQFALGSAAYKTLTN
jgi:protein involved in polysaccharide export with SLBB domain